MKKEILDSESKKWNAVYEATEPENLPWFGHSFPNEVEDYLKSLDPNDMILVTGCGVGDIAKTLSVKGFTQIIGTDISLSAINKAKSRFPGIAFETIATEEISLREKFRNVNVLDWLNLHQVKDIDEYLQSLGILAKNLCIVWIADSKDKSSAKSYVHSGNVYYHDASKVRVILESQGLILKSDFSFSFSSNPNAKVIRQHTAIGQIYERR